MDAFASMRHFINDNKDIFKRLTIVEYRMLEYDDNFEKIFNVLEPKKIEKQKIFFNGEIYDSYSLIIELIKEAKIRIIIIDSTLYYIGASLKDLGKKCFGINELEDKQYLNKIIESIN